MTLRTILVCLTNTSSAADVMKCAAILARRDNAHVIGLHVTESLIVYPSIAMHIPDITYQTFATSQKGHTQDLKDIFDAQTRAEGFPSEWRHLASDTATVADRIVESARSVDLVVMAQEDDSHDRTMMNNLQERVIRESGRPVLVIPRGYQADTLGDTVVLGWSPTREATRAAHDMEQVISPDAKVSILRIDKATGDELSDFDTNDLAAALARYGHDVSVIHREQAGEKVADVLSHEAFEIGADLLVTGAFGHSRTYDFVIGAVSRALLSDAKIPVLYSK
ncbi:universal stress protein [Yoonia sediminilitoris]|uniref:Nucleotide-binding universal stress UspA family protein n=1 Tax=Yoonia sediminilitoris TaxID=1286148 RepID=A0A2T6KIS4_9RHOB|nr:universal stress protein [Yoonia sediminilitoris]PUB15624.1 nucleotide-binding universal stress UspA family protein [Yoonia sediminilitoris]RCW96233.1 nucleotide-binding universal stress UspA family protein [Yoonia sediminilitoris]